jgi:hypothetical protein
LTRATDTDINGTVLRRISGTINTSISISIVSAFEQRYNATMKFSLAAASTLLLLPLGALASPVAAASDSLSPTRTGALGPRTSYFHPMCKIVNVNTYANCRSGPGTNYPTKYYPKKGVAYEFSCYKRGTCVSGNW